MGVYEMPGSVTLPMTRLPAPVVLLSPSKQWANALPTRPWAANWLGTEIAGWPNPIRPSTFGPSGTTRFPVWFVPHLHNHQQKKLNLRFILDLELICTVKVLRGLTRRR
jgi:hypothetical protein